MNRIIFFIVLQLFSTVLFAENRPRNIYAIKDSMQAAGWLLVQSYTENLAQMNSCTNFKPCFSGNEYCVLVVPEDYGVQNVNLSVYDQNDRLVTEKLNFASRAVVYYTCSESQTYTFKIVNQYSSRSGYAYPFKIRVYYRPAQISGLAIASAKNKAAYIADSLHRKLIREECVVLDSTYTFYYTFDQNVQYDLLAFSETEQIPSLRISENRLKIDTLLGVAHTSFILTQSRKNPITLRINQQDSLSGPAIACLQILYKQVDTKTLDEFHLNAWNTTTLKELLKDDGYTLLNEYEITLKQGDFWHTYRPFYSGNEYLVYAWPTNYGVQDLDVKLISSDGTSNPEFTQMSSDRIAYIHSSNFTSDTYTIQVTNHSSTYADVTFPITVLVFYR